MKRAFAASLLLLAACSRGPDESSLIKDRALASAAADAKTLSFVVLGDFGVGGERQGVVAEAIQEWAGNQIVEAFVTTGDNIYPSGHPGSFEHAWRRPYGWLANAKIPVVASLGNHDVRTDDGEPVMKLLDIPSPWYSKTIDGTQFLVLDANRPDNPAQLEFIATALDRSARWTIAVFHQPAFSCGKHGSTSRIKRLWVPLFTKIGVDLILNGHDHNYQRFDTTPPAVVTGGGGAGLYDMKTCPRGTPAPVSSAVTRHFMYIAAGPQSLVMRAIRASDGNVIDEATISG